MKINMNKTRKMTVPTLTDLLFIKRGFLSEEQCDVIINEYESSSKDESFEHCLNAFTGVDTFSSYGMKTPKVNSESFLLIHKTIEMIINEYHDFLDTFKSFHIKRKKSLLHPHLYRIMKYKTGAKIHPHVDHDIGTGVYGSCTINLNDEYKGGDFLFWGGKHRVKLGRGDVMIWPADFFWVHEVEQIKSGVRYSANTFLCSKPVFLSEDVKYNIKSKNSNNSLNYN